jgi:hypothetical protein
LLFSGAVRAIGAQRSLKSADTIASRDLHSKKIASFFAML